MKKKYIVDTNWIKDFSILYSMYAKHTVYENKQFSIKFSVQKGVKEDFMLIVDTKPSGLACIKVMRRSEEDFVERCVDKKDITGDILESCILKLLKKINIIDDKKE